MFKYLLGKLAEKFLDAALKANNSKKISQKEFKDMILRKDSNMVNTLSELLNISKTDVQKGINEYKKLLEKNKK